MAMVNVSLVTRNQIFRIAVDQESWIFSDIKTKLLDHRIFDNLFHFLGLIFTTDFPEIVPLRSNIFST